MIDEAASSLASQVDTPVSAIACYRQRMLGISELLTIELMRKGVRVSADTSSSSSGEESYRDDGDLTDLLGELRVLLPGAQTLTAFLTILPFNGGFSAIRDEEKIVYAITFICSVLSLVMFTAPAAHHRLQRPLRDREGFKTLASRLIVIGLIPLSMAIVLSTQLVLSEVVSTRWVSWTIAGGLAGLILGLWWVMPIRRHEQLDRQ